MKVIILFFLLISGLHTYSQNDILKNIRQQYYSIKKDIKAQEEGEYPENNAQLIIKQMMPAIGEQTITYHFYFELKENEEINENQEIDYLHHLNFVNKSYNIAQSEFIYEEFLFNNSGDLIFYYSKIIENEDSCRELRLYLNKNRLIHFIFQNGKLNNSENCDLQGQEKIKSEIAQKLPEFYDLNKIQKESLTILNLFKLWETN